MFDNTSNTVVTVLMILVGVAGLAKFVSNVAASKEKRPH